MASCRSPCRLVIVGVGLYSDDNGGVFFHRLPEKVKISKLRLKTLLHPPCLCGIDESFLPSGTTSPPFLFLNHRIRSGSNLLRTYTKSALTPSNMVKKPTIGLLGGGQLGRMLCEAAGPLGIDIAILDEANCPAKMANQNSRHVTGSFKDPAKIRELAAMCDVITVEIEHVNTEVLEEIATRGVITAPGTVKKVPVHPHWQTLRLIQDKFLQKEHFARAGLPIAPQMAIESSPAIPESLSAAYKSFGFPFMLKARKGSYDGRGNFKVNGVQDYEAAIQAMGKLSLYAEKWVPFDMELAVMVVRTEDEDGELRKVHTYPAVETIHEESICTKVYYPPRRVPLDVCEKARQVAGDVVKTLKGRGVFAVEMFLMKDGEFPTPSWFDFELTSDRHHHRERGGPSSSQLWPLHH